MNYKIDARENDFDLYVYDSNQVLVFFSSNVQYSDVSLLYLDDPNTPYLAFSTKSGFANLKIDLSVQQHFDLLESLRIFND